MKSIYSRIVPEAMASSVNSTMKGKKAAPARPATRTPVTPNAAAAGFKPVAAEPHNNDINWKLTTMEMTRKNQAILRDGSKVSWR